MKSRVIFLASILAFTFLFMNSAFALSRDTLKSGKTSVSLPDSSTYFKYIGELKHDSRFGHIYYLKEFYPNGKPQIESWTYMYKYDAQYSGYNPKLHSDSIEVLIGPVRMYYKTGHIKLLEVINGKNGDSTRVDETWYKRNGKIDHIQHYKQGDVKSHLSESEFKIGHSGFVSNYLIQFKNGIKYREGWIRDDKKEGVWSYYKQGQLKKTVLYAHGKRIKESLQSK
jgi:hypothetical protein